MTDDTPRRALPSNIRLLNRQRTVPATPRAAKSEPAAPDWLDDAAKTEWLRLAPLMAGDWRPEFADSLAAYCVMLGQFKANPAAFGAPRLAQLRAYQAALGLTPRSHRALLDSGKRR